PAVPPPQAQAQGFRRADRRPQPPEHFWLSSAVLFYKASADVDGTLAGHEMADFIHDFLRPEFSQSTGAAVLVNQRPVLAKNVAGLR
ncbi:hypothetical protein NL54_22045, partial [Pantoea stewartii]